MWWSDGEWAELSDPKQCDMCADAGLEENDHSLLVASTDTSWVRLSRNQAHPGYCVVVLREHITDMTGLEPVQLSRFWTDVQRAARGIEAVFAPRKVDYLVMGHRMPHLHCHLLPQHAADDLHRNVNIADGPTVPPDDVLRATAHELREWWHVAQSQ